jgi:hypothetical protein
VLLDDTRAIHDLESRLPKIWEVVDDRQIALLKHADHPAVRVPKDVADDATCLGGYRQDGLVKIARSSVVPLAEAGSENQDGLHSHFLRLKKRIMPAAMHAMRPRQRT